jgi:hypothetical protein
VCAEVAAISTLLAAERDDALRDVHVPAAGQVWWRSAIRAHAEAGRAARRPMVWLQGIAGAMALGAGAALLGLAWSSIREAAWLLALTWPIEMRAARPVRPALLAQHSLVVLS